MQFYRYELDVSEELEDLNKESLFSQETISIKNLLLSKELRWPLITTITLAVGLQLSGINAVLKWIRILFEINNMSLLLYVLKLI